MAVEMDCSKQKEATRVSLTLNSEDVNDIIYREKYEGEQKKALRNGFGTLTLKDGSYYKGNFYNGEIEGSGFKYFAETDNKYTGEFKAGELHGQGIMEYKNGFVYDGNWCENKKEGYGKLKFPDGSVYKGYFHNHKRHGTGTFEMKNGTTYTGDWICDRRQGQGHINYLDGSEYEGQWANDVINGYGCIKHISGITYTGLWINGLPEKMATKLAFDIRMDVLMVDEYEPFDIVVQCKDDEDTIVQEQGRQIEVLLAIKNEEISVFSLEESSSISPAGYTIIQNWGEIPSAEDELEDSSPDFQGLNHELGNSPHFMTIYPKRNIDGKVKWSNLTIFRELSCTASGSVIQKPSRTSSDSTQQYLLIAHDISYPTFLNRQLRSTYLKIYMNQKKVSFSKQV
ncbi:MORN repeat-containing protein 1 isoform X2 [Octopus bimaculoides]|uniref:MORN repeat-containing protein 1 isoform X2 n=1 Tax=Octopus bimaculoides TaxID=37653 RepID=UPI0022E83C1E|nr:MORN repeat-containing protein 1 isoform X2 [Octopus bimaculoides]